MMSGPGYTSKTIITVMSLERLKHQRLFVQQLGSEENNKAPHYCAPVPGIHRGRVHSHKKCQYRGKRIHIMI